jgi:hypothetical protein
MRLVVNEEEWYHPRNRIYSKYADSSDPLKLAEPARPRFSNLWMAPNLSLALIRAHRRCPIGALPRRPIGDLPCRCRPAALMGEATSAGSFRGGVGRPPSGEARQLARRGNVGRPPSRLSIRHDSSMA